MIIEIILLILIFSLTLLTNSLIFKILLVPALLICLPGLYGLRSAPYVPTLKKNVETMFKFASIKPGMKVYDLGAGDGKLVEKASRKGGLAIGYEISIGLVIYFWLKKIFLRKKGKVFWGSLWSKDISDADVVLCFLMPNAMERFEREKFPNMKKGAKFISNIFSLPNTKADKEANNVYLYIKK